MLRDSPKSDLLFWATKFQHFSRKTFWRNPNFECSFPIIIDSLAIQTKINVATLFIFEIRKSSKISSNLPWLPSMSGILYNFHSCEILRHFAKFCICGFTFNFRKNLFHRFRNPFRSCLHNYLAYLNSIFQQHFYF